MRSSARAEGISDIFVRIRTIEHESLAYLTI